MLSDGLFDLLVLSSDDTSEYGLPSREKRWLGEWAGRLAGSTGLLLMYPGADEVGCALLARVLNRQHNRKPRFALDYAVPGDEEVTAPFEDGPVRITVERQIRAVGGVLVSDPHEADFVVAVNTPSRSGRTMFDPAIADEERAWRLPYLDSFSNRIARWVEEGRRIIIVDVAYPNGADPVLIELLRARVTLPRLAAYGGWNTAGNTIGVALAQGIVGLSAQTSDQADAHERFLVHRFIEDWGYQHVVRTEVAAALIAQNGHYQITSENAASVKVMIEDGLRQQLAQLPGFAGRWRLVPGSVRLPWKRLFEVDFDLEKIV